MSFFERIPFEAAVQLEEWSRVAFELREGARQVLARYGVDTPEALAALMDEGAVAARPALDDYVAACFLATAREDARSALAATAHALGG
jgi:hypothetical protein